MVLQDKRDELAQINPFMILLDDPAFDKSIIGVTDDDRAVYNFDYMILELSQDDDIDVVQAQEFIEYNTLRALPYAGANAPLVIYPIMYDDEWKDTE